MLWAAVWLQQPLWGRQYWESQVRRGDTNGANGAGEWAGRTLRVSSPEFSAARLHASLPRALLISLHFPIISLFWDLQNKH